MKVIEYLKEHGIEKMKEEFHISVKEYGDRIVLNYDQIESPRFHPICDECRGLILDKDYNVMCRSFHRFFNYGEGIQGEISNGDIVNYKNAYEEKALNIKEAKIYHKMDGTLINIYWDKFNNCWQCATRGMAFAEGGNEFSDSFATLVKSAKEYKDIISALDEFSKSVHHFKSLTFIFELTSPFNRIVTPYDETSLTLLAVKDDMGFEYSREILEEYSKHMKCKLPSYYTVNSGEELLNMVNEFPSMQEGVVLVWENDSDLGYTRIKCKNLKYVAIHNMRGNGLISVHRILTLVMQNETSEYLSYFECDKPYFDFVEEEYNKFINEVKLVYSRCKDIDNQKDFAISIMNDVSNKSFTSYLFNLRKGISLESQLETMSKMEHSVKKLTEVLDLKSKFMKKFNIKEVTFWEKKNEK